MSRPYFCPVCNSEWVRVTLAGSILPGPFPGANTNRATCDECGWRGLAYERVEKFARASDDKPE